MDGLNSTIRIILICGWSIRGALNPVTLPSTSAGQGMFMETFMRTLASSFWAENGGAEVPKITPIMENQMEKKMENEMEAGII